MLNEEKAAFFQCLQAEMINIDISTTGQGSKSIGNNFGRNEEGPNLANRTQIPPPSYFTTL